MHSDERPEPVCPVCARSIPAGAALTFMRRDNLIHVGCLIAAQRRAEPPRSDASTATSRQAPRDES